MSDSTKAPDLLPCPFCGSDRRKPILWKLEGERYHVSCAICIFHTFAGSRQEAVANWNRRAVREERSGLREALAELMHTQWAEINRSILRKLQPSSLGTIYSLIAEEHDRRAKLAMTPYANFSEADKDKDREQADRVLAILQPLPEPQSPSTTKGEG